MIITGKTQVVISKENRLYVCKTADEVYHPACVGEHGRNVRISAMFWVHVTYSGVGKLLPITGNMNSEKYINTLDEFLWPVVTKQFGNSSFIFQDDNAPCHASTDCLDWPSKSPEINIIENVWHILKIRLKRYLVTIRNL